MMINRICRCLALTSRDTLNRTQGLALDILRPTKNIRVVLENTTPTETSKSFQADLQPTKEFY